MKQRIKKILIFFADYVFVFYLTDSLVNTKDLLNSGLLAVFFPMALVLGIIQLAEALIPSEFIISFCKRFTNMNSKHKRLVHCMFVAFSAVQAGLDLPAALSMFIHAIIMLCCPPDAALIVIVYAIELLFSSLTIISSILAWQDFTKMRLGFEFQAKVCHYEKRARKAHMSF